MYLDVVAVIAVVMVTELTTSININCCTGIVLSWCCCCACCCDGGGTVNINCCTGFVVSWCCCVFVVVMVAELLTLVVVLGVLYLDVVPVVVMVMGLVRCEDSSQFEVVCLSYWWWWWRDKLKSGIICVYSMLFHVF